MLRALTQGSGGAGLTTLTVGVGATPIAGGTANALLFVDSTGLLLADSANLTFGPAAGQGLAIAAGTATTAVNAVNISQTWSAGGTLFTGLFQNVTNTASASGSLFFDFQVGSVSRCSFSKDGVLTLGAGAGPNPSCKIVVGTFNGEMSVGSGTTAATNWLYFDGNNNHLRGKSASMFAWSATTDPSAASDAGIARGGANQIVVNGGVSGGGGTTTSRAEINKLVTAIANNTATATLTVTIPNGAHSAGGKFILKGAAGAGGAIGADEFTAGIEYDWVVTRTAGVNAVATLSTSVITAITASVAGGATPTISAALSAIAGAVGAANTFTLNVTINALTGSSTNHTCFCYGSVLNDNASGVTIA